LAMGSEFWSGNGEARLQRPEGYVRERLTDRRPLVRQPSTARPPDRGTFRVSHLPASLSVSAISQPARPKQNEPGELTDLTMLAPTPNRSCFHDTWYGIWANSCVPRRVLCLSDWKCDRRSLQRNCMLVIRVIGCDGFPSLHFNVCMEQCCLNM
jgi:hypothetical protein